MDKAQAMRFDACLPQSYWDFSVDHAVHIYNRTPVRRLGFKTPFEIVEKKVPDISHLRVFGCAAYVHLPEAVRANKLAPKSELMVYLGQVPGVKGWKFMRDNTRLFIGSTAIFDETLFPCCTEKKKGHGFTPVERQDDGTTVPQEDVPFDDEDRCRSPSPSLQRGPWQNHGSDSSRAPTPPPAGTPPVTPPREQSPQREQQEPLPRRSGRLRKIPPRPENIHGDSQPPSLTERESRYQRYWKGKIPKEAKVPYNRRNIPGGEQVPGPSSLPNPDTHDDDGDVDNGPPVPGVNAPDEQELVAQLAQEGGVRLMNFLLSCALPTHDDVPTQYRDIARLPKLLQEEWKAACLEEMQALR